MRIFGSRSCLRRSRRKTPLNIVEPFFDPVQPLNDLSDCQLRSTHLLFRSSGSLQQTPDA
jgi:hypothetical protein